ncbi:MAG TPA: universal stress protein [Blastocatellia bacterium]|nr:universal stress protein [Blastocatellia bacterium]
MKTLIATDGSPEATTALRTTARLLRRSRNEIEVLCVAPELESPARQLAGRRTKDATTHRTYQQRIARETASILDEAKTILDAEGIGARLFSETGSPADVIVELAEEHEVTVVGASGRRHASQPGLGSVASRVVEHAQGTVLLARELANPETLRVLAGVDGSLASKHALSALTAYFEIDSAEITLIHVKETPWIHLGLDREWFDYPRDVFDQADPEIQLEEELQREAEAVLEAAQARLAKYNYSVSTLIEDGNPATAILGEAESGQYDLIILGAGSPGTAKRNMLGSVSARIAWQAPCSVAVVKPVE